MFRQVDVYCFVSSNYLLFFFFSFFVVKLPLHYFFHSLTSIYPKLVYIIFFFQLLYLFTYFNNFYCQASLEQDASTHALVTGLIRHEHCLRESLNQQAAQKSQVGFVRQQTCIHKLN